MKTDMMRHILTKAGAWLPAAVAMVLAGCGAPKVPEGNVEQSERAAVVVPDYTGVTIPPNIAPLNFEIDMPGDEYVVRVSGAGGASLTEEGKTIEWDPDGWRNLLAASRGGDLDYEVYVRRGERWTCHKFSNHVAPEEIDRYLSYRLIEPSFEQYSALSLNQRDLTTFDETVIWNNPSPCDERRGYCINCHVPRNQYKDRTSLFHVRGNSGGTIIMTGGKIEKVDLKTDSTLTAGVYPSWHPTLDLIAFSTNETIQTFPGKGSQRVEVLDKASDLILYDVARHEVSNISADPQLLETYPCWAADGKRLYYSVGRYPDGVTGENIHDHWSEMRYDIVSRDFDISGRRFSEADTVVCASGEGKSALLPRISPDGRYLLYCKAPFGSFHIWHKDSDLHIVDLRSGTDRELANANSGEAESYHSWSSESRWIVFSSRRDDGSYTRPYIAYIDGSGCDRKAFVVPQKSPRHYDEQMKSYNVPEFMSEPFAFSRSDILPNIRSGAEAVAFKSGK